MSVEIKKVATASDLKQFIQLNYDLYKGNAYAVPDLAEDLRQTFDPQKNAAYDFCESELFLALKDGKVVGRIACIINRKANATWDNRNARFGWIDFIDDLAVSRALLETAERWGKERGCDKIVGPLGFTDMDPEGMLIEGFDQLSTMATIYNYPYYPQHLEAHGYSREIDWVERKIFVPRPGHEANQAKYFRVAALVEKRFKLHVRKFKSGKELLREGYVQKIFDLINTAYAPLYGYSQMNERQVARYAEQYIPFLDMRLVPVVENEAGEVVGVGICMPSLAHALQKAQGKLLPFGWFHLLKSLKWKHAKIVDLLLVAVAPEYQNKGVNAMLFADIIPIAMEMGFETAESHPQLETNHESQNQWDYLDNIVHKRRRCFQKDL